ncbi:iron-hydroxamate ABC transporter substrate-binding protein [Lentibacillus salicampi]|uniref:Iron-hydroxamate ABC transporter substrate-binding protein n=1 Tax=Lentibacillus salicampi TaxID=175306 RepID=A0A4Y9ACE3_9BACI|nr:iron-hydroxamate ABC transporter substrate-binding protein [Lentibacillus salicampi]TFJ93568.1 iron-hydroxamate ABC transporter substrate-binding protein [Lentibacillus salicampi]
MNKMGKSYNVIMAFLVALTVLLTACGGNGSDEDSTTGDEGDQTSDVTLDSKMGKVTIPGDAERIIAPYHEDALLALGVTPVAKWAIGETVQDYLADQLKDVPKIEWNLPLEQVLEHEPDLVILENAIDSYEGSYEDYQKIATTYVMSEETTNNWRQQIETFGKMLDKEAKAEEVLNQYDKKVADAKETLHQAIGDETVAMIWAKGDQFFLFEKNRHSAEVLYSELGISQPELVKELGEAGQQWNPISLEKLSELQADHVFLLGQENEQGLETLQNSSVWQGTPAAQNDRVYVINDPSPWTNKGLIASKRTIDDVLETLAN